MDWSDPRSREFPESVLSHWRHVIIAMTALGALTAIKDIFVTDIVVAPDRHTRLSFPPIIMIDLLILERLIQNHRRRSDYCIPSVRADRKRAANYCGQTNFGSRTSIKAGCRPNTKRLATGVTYIIYSLL